MPIAATTPAKCARPAGTSKRSAPCRWINFLANGLVLCGLTSFPEAAYAFRPFDGTDAEVADLGHLEVELQPLGAARAEDAKALVGPAAVINYGFATDWEAVLQGELVSQISPLNQELLVGNGVFLKHVVLDGSLQDKPGPSVAAEFGLVLPNVDVGSAFVKPSWTWIISDRFPWGTVHLNFTANFMSDPHTDFFVDAILEGPADWSVRPVAELYSDTMIGGPQTYSALAGAIWQVSKDLALDVAVRHAFVGREQETELRAGLTISLPIYEMHAAPSDAARISRPMR